MSFLFFFIYSLVMSDDDDDDDPQDGPLIPYRTYPPLWISGQLIHVLGVYWTSWCEHTNAFSSGFIGHKLGDSEVQRDMASVIHGCQ